MKKNVLILIVLICSFSVAMAEVSLTTSVDKNQLTIGDRVLYRVMFVYNEEIEIVLPPVADNLGHFEIKDFVDKKAYKNENDEWVKEYQYEITTFFTGVFIIPPLDFKYKQSDGEEVVLKSNEHRLEVKSLTKEDDQDIKDIKPPLAIPFNYNPFIYGGIILVLVLIGIIIYFRLFRKKNINALFKEEIKIPPFEQALRILAETEKKYLAEDRFCKAYYSGLSYAFRVYYERKNDVKALEMTSDEFIAELRRDDKERADLDDMEDFLLRGDFVKFAKALEDIDQRKQDLNWLRDWLNRQEAISLDAEYNVDDNKEVELVNNENQEEDGGKND